MVALPTCLRHHAQHAIYPMLRFRQIARGLKGNTVRITHQGPIPWLPSQL